MGALKEEWYLYALAHEVSSIADIQDNLARYYPASVVDIMMDVYKDRMRDDLTKDELFRLFGDMLAEGQVHLPARLLHRDLLAAGFPVARYQIRWTPEQLRPFGMCLMASCDAETSNRKQDMSRMRPTARCGRSAYRR